MLSRALIPLMLMGCTPAVVGSILAQKEPQQPLGMWHPSTNPATAPATSSDTTSSGDNEAPPYRADLVALHRHLVEISSVTGTEQAVGDFLVDYFVSRSWNYEVQEVPPKNNTPEGQRRFNVAAWPPRESGQRPDPKVLVTSHIDVVPPHIPYSITPDPAGAAVGADTVIAGRGTVDAKGSVAAQITAVEDLVGSGAVRPEDVMVLYVVGEEQGGDGMRLFSSSSSSSSAPSLAPNIRAAIFGEPTENRLACGHKGGMVCDVTATGRAGHSGYPWLGKSANEVLMRGLLGLLDADLGSSERYGNTTVNVGIMGGGVALNVIPAHASATLMCRVALEPQETGHLAVIAKMKEVLAGVDDEALSLDCSTGSGVVPCDCDVDGFDTIVANYGTDIPYLKGEHTTYLYGPGSILVAHGDDEALTVGDLETAVEGFKTLIIHALEL